VRVLLVAEGESELGNLQVEGSLAVLVRRLLPETREIVGRKVSDRAVRTHRQPGQGGGFERRALLWLRYAGAAGFDALVLVIDEDGDPQRGSELDAAQRRQEFPLGRAFGLAIRTYDAWMLADERALGAALGGAVGRQRSPERLRDPKRTLNQLSSRHACKIGFAALCAAVAARVDLECLAARCPQGFSPWADRVRALSSEGTS
jgi:hypothetical protein